MLAFSFTTAYSRHHERREYVLNEANAIGTCYLRAGLLDEPHRTRVRETLREYLDARLDLSRQAGDPAAVTINRARLSRLLEQLWSEVEMPVRAHPQPQRYNLLVQSTNDVIDLASMREYLTVADLQFAVVATLRSAALATALLIGHTSGQSGARHIPMWAALNLLMILILFLELDFDRPRRGLVQVDHGPLDRLQESHRQINEPRDGSSLRSQRE